MIEESEFRKTSESISDMPSSLREQIENNEEFDVLTNQFNDTLDFKNFSLTENQLHDVQRQLKNSFFDFPLENKKGQLELIMEEDSEQNVSRATEFSQVNVSNSKQNSLKRHDLRRR